MEAKFDLLVVLLGVAVLVDLVGSDCMLDIAVALAVQNELRRLLAYPGLPGRQLAVLAVDLQVVLQMVVLLGKVPGREHLELLQVLMRARGAVVVSYGLEKLPQCGVSSPCLLTPMLKV